MRPVSVWRNFAFFEALVNSPVYLHPSQEPVGLCALTEQQCRQDQDQHDLHFSQDGGRDRGCDLDDQGVDDVVAERVDAAEQDQRCVSEEAWVSLNAAESVASCDSHDEPLLNPASICLM